jgi:hypothetical protein
VRPAQPDPADDPRGGEVDLALPDGRVRLSETAAEPANECDRRGDGVGGRRWGAAAAGGRGGLDEAVVVGGSAEVVDVLLGDEAGGLRMHGWTSCWDLVRAL